MNRNDRMLGRPEWPRNPGHAIEFGASAEIAAASAEPRASRYGRNRDCRVAPPFVTFRAKRRRMLRSCLNTGSHDIHTVGQTLNEGGINGLSSCPGDLQPRAVISTQVPAGRISAPATPIPLGAQASRPPADRPPPGTTDGTPACPTRWRPVRRMPRHELHLRHPLPRRRPRAGRRAGGARPGGAWRGVGRRQAPGSVSVSGASLCRAGHQGAAFRPRGGSGGGRGRPARRSRRPVRRPRRAPLRTCRPCRRRAGSARLPTLGTKPPEPPPRRLRLCRVGRREAHPLLRPGTPRGSNPATTPPRRRGSSSPAPWTPSLPHRGCPASSTRPWWRVR